MSDETVPVRDASAGFGLGDALPEVIVIGEERLSGEVLARRDPRPRTSATDDAGLEADARVPAGDGIGTPLYDLAALLLAHVLAVDAKTTKE